MSSLARNTEYKADKQRQKQVNLQISSQMQPDSSSRTDKQQSVTAVSETFLLNNKTATKHLENWMHLNIKDDFHAHKRWMMRNGRRRVRLRAQKMAKHTLQIYFGGNKM